jgi:thioredoxin 1
MEDREIEAIRRRIIMRMLRGEETGVTGPITLTDGNFDDALTKYRVLVVDFWAPWCGPCRMIAPTIERLAREFAGRAVFGKLNVDENPATAARYGVMSIPTVVIFRDGKPVDAVVGAVPYPALKERVERWAD